MQLLFVQNDLANILVKLFGFLLGHAVYEKENFVLTSKLYSQG